jgi:hypothetical protein
MRPDIGRVATESNNPAFAGIVHAAETHFISISPPPSGSWLIADSSLEPQLLLK